ncbi:hypothetical protein GALMADRAFT_1326228 [Galerina marginata CBS 339.88]|uniref:Uncharacterized protein n=1 Tax=Galerina marginata (strain CBS 339.88) TaxID=685588 RepID=A0A067T2V6_GALM3|nr:hypothetical protein GALMADRAFT_1326228 [Galerina marginata CBS 339.88]
MAVGSFSISLAVNAIVTSLLVLKIVLLHRELGGSGLRTEGMYELRPLISIIIESGMFTFVAQTIWVVFVRLEIDGNTGFGAVISPTTMIYGITPTIVLVRAAMGRSYDLTVIRSAIEFSPQQGNTNNSVADVSFGAHMGARRDTGFSCGRRVPDTKQVEQEEPGHELHTIRQVVNDVRSGTTYTRAIEYLRGAAENRRLIPEAVPICSRKLRNGIPKMAVQCHIEDIPCRIERLIASAKRTPAVIYFISIFYLTKYTPKLELRTENRPRVKLEKWPMPV